MSKNTDLAGFDTSLPVANLTATGTISVGSNVVVNTSQIFIGNSSVNSVVNSSSISVGSFVINSSGFTTNTTFNSTIFVNNVVSNGTAYVSNGFYVTAGNWGVISANVTMSASNGNYQYATTNAAFTWTAPTTDCAIDILITNGSGAGTITFSGFTVQSGGTGDTYATTNGNKYLISVRRINSTSTYLIKALQ